MDGALTIYAMVAFYRDDGNASEAAMKYFVLGAIASGMLLFGMSILYGLSGSLDIEDEPHVAEQHTGITGARLNARIYRGLLAEHGQ